MFRVLFVCTGNICRSPIAHGLLVDRSTRVGGNLMDVRSAGTWGRLGSAATREAVSAAAELGIDIQAHRSSPFTSELAGWADLVITMTSDQAQEVREQAPEAGPKTFTFKELDAILGSLPPASKGTARQTLLRRVNDADAARSSGHPSPVDLDVADPLGLSDAFYRAIAHELEQLIDELLRGLLGERESAAADS